MLSLFRWIGVILGIAVMLLLARFLGAFVGEVLLPYFGVVTGVEEPGWGNVGEKSLYYALTGVSHLSALLLAFFVGGLLVGGWGPYSSGLSGAVSGVVVAILGLASWIGPLIPSILIQIDNPGDVYTRAENLGNLVDIVVIFCAVCPLLVLASYLGGRLGGRLRDRTTRSGAERRAR